MYRYRRFRRRTDPRQVAAAAAIGFALTATAAGHAAASARHHGHGRPPAAAPHESRAAARAVAYARAQLGRPYLWGGTGPAAFDCSGLVMRAWQAAGVNIPRVAADQWASLPHVPARQRDAGDLVFFAGADGTPSAPGHVGMVLGRRSMVEAYASGVPIRVSQYGTPASAPGDGSVVGFADPGAGS